MSKNEYEETVRELYPTFSQVEIAEATHTSKSTCQTRCHRTPPDPHQGTGKGNTLQNTQETDKEGTCAYCLWLGPAHQYRLVTNPRKVKYRTKLKNDGYIVMRGSNTIYYTPEQKRHRHREENARKAGLDFAPWSVPAVIYKQTWLGA